MRRGEVPGPGIPGLSLPDLPDAARLILPLEGVTLGGYVWWQPRPAPAALLLHGWGQDASALAVPARLLHARGWHALSLSLRGWRGSSGCDDYGLSGPGDTRRALAWLAAQPWVTSTAVLGLSLGGLIALLMAARESGARAVVAVNPPTDLRRVYDSTASRVLRAYYDAVLTDAQWQEGSPMHAARQLQTPAWVVVGAEDRICLPSLGRDYARASGAGLLEVAGMGHVPEEGGWAATLQGTLELLRP